MNESYVECLVKAKASMIGKIVPIICYVLVGISVLFLLMGYSFGIIAVVLFGGIAYFVSTYTDVEYEYLYVDKEISIDRILAKANRKTVANYTLESMEVLAPIHSYHLDDFKNRQVRTLDFSVGDGHKPDLRYVMYYEGNLKVILSPSEDMIKVLKNYAPRKVFSE